MAEPRRRAPPPTRSARRSRRASRRTHPAAACSTPPVQSRAPPIRVRGDPMAGDIDAPANPNLLVLQNILEEALQRGNTAGPPGQPAVQAHRQHLGLIEPVRIAFAVQRIESRAQIVEKLSAGIE